MITIKSENFKATAGKVYDSLIGAEALARGVYLKVDSPVAMRLEKLSDKVVITFNGDKPKLSIKIPLVSVAFTEIESITIYKESVVIKLDGFPDIRIVEDV